MAHQAVARLLLGEAHGSLEIPALPELTAAATALAAGQRHKTLLPLASSPAELALVRHGDRVLVSCYTTATTPEVFVLHRPVPLRSLLDVCAHATREAARHDDDRTARTIAERLAERALATAVAEPEDDLSPIARTGGTHEAPRRGEALAFGWEARFHAGTSVKTARASRADVHALLFDGTLFCHLHGRRVLLAKGPIVLPVLRMLAAVRALLEARDAGRNANVRLRAGNFQIGLRGGRDGEVALTLGGEGGKSVTAGSLPIDEAVGPILKLASELVRSLVAADRSQTKNLRVKTLREEIRTIRRMLRAPRDRRSFVNDDPDRLRFGIPDELPVAPQPLPLRPASPSLRFGERWRIAVDGLDAMGTFLCGDRLVLSTSKHTVAISRDDGQVLWARPGEETTNLMAGTVLLRLFGDGRLELCDVGDGEPFAEARLAPRNGHAAHACVVGGGSVPPVAVLTEGPDRLVAIDLRTGEIRWRFVARHGGPMRMTKAGRILVVATGDGSVHAVDVATGEDAWCFTADTRFAATPTIVRDAVVALSNGGSDGPGAAYGIDLFSGRLRFRRPLAGAPSAVPLAASSLAFVATNSVEGAFVEALDVATGELRFRIADPGLGQGGAGMGLDDRLVVNAPGGKLCSIGLEDGQVTWSHRLADESADDVPRRLEPVLRAGALFVPAASVHVVRPADGALLAASLPCDLVPDLLRVDERGWVYVAEESGHVAAYAPVAHLTLIRGGGA